MTKENTIEEKLKLLREPFPPEHISHLPKPTCKKDEYDKLQKGNCKVCGGYHATSKTIHLSYVGHAALTDRLLSVDPTWTWEPMALTEKGLPLFDESGGLWIRLTILGVTRFGYGHAKNNTFAEIGSREKEVIGDALRNSAMRFGCALDLWSKADLSKQDEEKLDEEPGREKVESGLKWIDDQVKTSLGALVGGWNKFFVPRKAEFSAEHWNELNIAYNDVKKYWEEKGEK